MSEPVKQPCVQDTDFMHVGKFAVFRHCFRIKSARFVVLHDTLNEAQAVADRMAFEFLEKNGVCNYAFYCVQISSRVGVIDGRVIEAETPCTSVLIGVQ